MSSAVSRTGWEQTPQDTVDELMLAYDRYVMRTIQKNSDFRSMILEIYPKRDRILTKVLKSNVFVNKDKVKQDALRVLDEYYKIAQRYDEKRVVEEIDAGVIQVVINYLPTLLAIAIAFMAQPSFAVPGGFRMSNPYAVTSSANDDLPIFGRLPPPEDPPFGHNQAVHRFWAGDLNPVQVIDNITNVTQPEPIVEALTQDYEMANTDSYTFFFATTLFIIFNIILSLGIPYAYSYFTRESVDTEERLIWDIEHFVPQFSDDEILEPLIDSDDKKQYWQTQLTQQQYDYLKDYYPDIVERAESFGWTTSFGVVTTPVVTPVTAPAVTPVVTAPAATIVAAPLVYTESPHDKELRKRTERGQKLRELEPQWLYVLEKWQRHLIHCVNNHDYYEIENVGTWKCRQHAMKYDELKKEWPCCHQPSYNEGCVKADHRPYIEPYRDVHTIKQVPDLIKKSMKGPRPGYDALNNHYVRYDVEGYEKIMSKYEEEPLMKDVLSPRFSNTITVLSPNLKIFRKYEKGIEHDGSKIIFWDGNHSIVETTNINLDQLSGFIFRQTSQEVIFKTGKIETKELVRQSGRLGVYYKTGFASKVEFTPIERVKQWDLP